jgi:DNA-binding response OmpR family regulator
MIRRRILLVEDEPGLRRTVTDLLVADGYIVESAADGLVGQELAIREAYRSHHSRHHVAIAQRIRGVPALA